jgi:hypothetical protein
MKPARKPNDPRKMSLKSPFGPHLVNNEVTHPLNAPIAIPATAYRAKQRITTIKGGWNTLNMITLATMPEPLRNS